MSLSGQNGGFNGAVLQYSTYGLRPEDDVFSAITSGSMYLSGVFIHGLMKVNVAYNFGYSWVLVGEWFENSKN